MKSRCFFCVFRDYRCGNRTRNPSKSHSEGKSLAFCSFKMYFCTGKRENDEIMAYYKLIRMPANGKAVRGRLYEVRETRFEEELVPICDTMENADYLIPALIYGIGVTQSPKFKRLLPIVRQVPGRTGIRFHRGTRPEHSKGCILVPPSMEQELTSRWLAEQTAHEEIRLEICNHTNLNLR